MSLQLKIVDAYMRGSIEWRGMPQRGRVFEPDGKAVRAAAAIVLKAGAKVTLRAGDMHYGGGSFKFGDYCFCYRNTQLELTGPLSAAELVRAFTRHVAIEVGRNYMLFELLYGRMDLMDEDEDEEKHGEGPPRQPQPEYASQQWRPPRWRRLTAEERARFSSAEGPAAVLELDPDPLEGAPEEELIKMGDVSLSGGATDLLGFAKCTGAPAGTYVAEWGGIYA